MFDSLLGVNDLVVLTILYVAYRAFSSGRRGGVPLPPGPKGWPIVGNMLDIPKTFHWLKYAEWSNQYGPITYITILGHRMIIINSARLANELMEKRRANYSERPCFTMITDLVGWDQITVLMPIGDLWKEHRKIFFKLLGTRATVEKFNATEVFEARRFMRAVLKEPTKMLDHVRYWAGGLLLKIAYGYQTKDGHDELVELVDEAMDQFTFLGKPGQYLVDSFPILRYVPAWFPGAGFQKYAQYCRKTLTDMIDIPFNLVHERLKAGTAASSFTSDVLSADDYTPEKEYALKTSAATIYAGGADTTAGQVHGLILMMMLWPEAQRKAQEELDRVVGPDRLPDFSDRENLPYIEACVKEALRLHNIAPGAGVRRALKDDVLEGYFIPKGTFIQPNVWQRLHDPAVYPDPMNFLPERWLVESPPPPPREMMFGFGRRICPGMVLAEASLWISCTMFISLFNIKPTKGSPATFDQGEGGVLDGHTLCHPLRFKNNITPRSAKAEALILSIEHEL